jgi:hypothetical protein
MPFSWFASCACHIELIERTDEADFLQKGFPTAPRCIRLCEIPSLEKLDAHGVVLLFVLNVSAVAAAQGDSFDVPLKKKVVDFGPSPYYSASQNVRVKLSCYFYSTFMVKEYDKGQKGAEWLAIVPVEARATPACVQSLLRVKKLSNTRSGKGISKEPKGI